MFNAFASDLIVAAEGETEAFSILDSIPAEIPVAAPSSEPVILVLVIYVICGPRYQ